jgi:type II secretory pathway predicted ATPase ExeA
MHIEDIKNFSKSDAPLMLVLGEAGSGKSELLQQTEEQLTSANVVRLHGKQHIKPRFMVQELSSHWHIPVVDHGEPLVDQLHTLVNGLIREKRLGFLIVDDAHLLPYSVLAALVHIAIAQENGCHLHLLLSGRVSMLDKIKTLHDQDFPLISLGEMPEHEARQHIEDFLEQNHISASKEAVDTIVRRLYKESSGIPSRIDKLLRELTLRDFMHSKATAVKKQEEHVEAENELEPPKPRRVIFRQDHWLGEHGARGFAVFALLLTLGGMYWYEHHMPSVSPPMPAKPYHYALSKAVPLMPPLSQKLEPVPKSAVLAAAKKPLHGVATTAAVKQSVATHAVAPVVQAVKAHVATTRVNSISPQVKNHVALAKSVVPQMNTHAAMTTPKLATAHSTSPHYTIQLMGSFKRADVQQHQQRLHVASTQIYNETFKNKPWYILGVGNYKSHQQAVTALHQIPQSLQKTGAWVRRVD